MAYSKAYQEWSRMSGGDYVTDKGKKIHRIKEDQNGQNKNADYMSKMKLDPAKGSSAYQEWASKTKSKDLKTPRFVLHESVERVSDPLYQPSYQQNALENLARQTVDDARRSKTAAPVGFLQRNGANALRTTKFTTNYLLEQMDKMDKQKREQAKRANLISSERVGNRKDTFVPSNPMKKAEPDPRTEYRRTQTEVQRPQMTSEEGRKLIEEYNRTHSGEQNNQSIRSTNAMETMQLRQNARAARAEQEENRRRQAESEKTLRRQSGREGNITDADIRNVNPEDLDRKSITDRALEYLKHDPSGSPTASFGDVLYPSLRTTGNPLNHDLNKKYGLDRFNQQDLAYFAAAGSLSANNPLMQAEKAAQGSPIQADRAQVYTMMTPEEKQNYNAILARDGLTKAEEYHDNLLDDINRRIAHETYETGAKDAGTAPNAMYMLSSSFGHGMGALLGDLGNFALGTSNTKATPVSGYVANEIATDPNNTEFQKAVYNIAQSTGYMAPGLIASAFLGPEAGSVVFALEQTGSAYREAINAGESTATATMYGLQQGVDEAATNFLLGGIGAFGGGEIKRVIQEVGGDNFTKALERVVKTPEGRQLVGRVMDYVSDMGGEAAQEYVQFYTENWTKALLGMKDENGNPVVANFNPLDPNALYAALLGALNAGVLNVPQAVGRTTMASRMNVDDAQQVADYINNELDISSFSEEDVDKAIRLADIAENIQKKQEQGLEPSLVEKAAYASATDELLTSDSVRESRENKWKELEKQDIENLSEAFFGDEGKKAFETEIAPENRLNAYRTFVAYYNHGYSGAKIPTEIERNAFKVMSTDQLSAAMRAGALDHQTNFPDGEVKAIEDSTSKIKIEGTKEGRIDKSRINENLLTSQQRFRIRYSSALIAKTLGIDVEFFQSVVGKDGKFYNPEKYKEGSPDNEEAKNGAFYISAEGRPTIRLDVNAGMMRNSDWTGELGDIKTMLPIISHELTHYLEVSAPEMYKELSNMVINSLIANRSYGAGLDFNTIVNWKRIKMEESEKRPRTADDALREIVAQACEDMLSGNEDAVNTFEKMNNKTKRYVWNHIKKVFKNIEEFFRQLLGTYRSGSSEAQAIRQNMEEFEKIRTKWQEALGFATEELNRGAELESTENETEQNAMRSEELKNISDEDRQNYIAFKKELMRADANRIKRGSNMKVMEYTPQILVDAGLEDKRIFMSVKHYREIIHEEVFDWNKDKYKQRKNQKKHDYHGLSRQEVSEAPIYLNNPAMIIDADPSKHDNSVIVIANSRDYRNRPIMLALKTNGENGYNIDTETSNFLTTLYGREGNFEKYLTDCINDDRLLFINKEKSQELFKRGGHQLPSVLNNLSFDTIIHQSNNVVKSPYPSKANRQQFSLRSSVEETRNLVAVHNITAEKLQKMFKYEGLPMPSIAITKADIGHENFGGISLVFRKDTIDPKNKKNKVYSADAWTPTFPQIEYQANEKTENRLRNKYYDLAKKYGREAVDAFYRYGVTLEDALNRVGGAENIIKEELNNPKMAQVFLYDTGRGESIPEVKTEVKETRTPIPENTRALAQYMIDHIGKEKLESGQVKSRDYMTALAERMENEFGLDKDEALAEARKQGLGYYVNLSKTVRAFLRGEDEIITRETKTDSSERSAFLDETLKSEEYKTWLQDQFADAEQDKGIYNGKERFTRMGGRKSFKQTHYDVTAANIVRAMLNEGNGNAQNTAGFTAGIKSVRSSAAKRFSSIEDIKASSENLQTTDSDTYTKQLGELDTRLVNAIYAVRTRPNDFMEADSIGEILIEGIEQKRTSPEALKKLYEGYHYNLSDDIAKEFSNIIKEVQELPVNMFEAKPERVVAWDEIAMAILPTDIDPAISEGLEKRGVDDIRFYVAGDEKERLKQLNSNKDIQFSSRESKWDEDYMRAVKNGDTKQQEKLVRKAAKAAGYTVEGYHGTERFGFTKVDPRMSDDRMSFFVTSDIETARTYSTTDRIRQVKEGEMTAEEMWETEDKAQEEASDAAINFVTAVNEVAGTQGWANPDEIIKELEKIAQDNSDDATTASDEIMDYLEEWLENLYSMRDDEDIDYIDWLETDDMKSVMKAHDALHTAYLDYAEAVGTDTSRGNYHVFINTDGVLEVEGNGADWNKITFMPEELKRMKDRMDEIERNHVRSDGPLYKNKEWVDLSTRFDEMADEIYNQYLINPRNYSSTRGIARYAKGEGYTGVVFHNITDDGGKGTKRVSKPADVYALFNPQSQVKSADPVTYDNDGNVISLSERFNPEENDIRYSSREETIEIGYGNNKEKYKTDKLTKQFSDEGKSRSAEISLASTKSEILKLAKDFYSKYQSGTANENNFFINTIAEFKETSRPRRKPDYVSRTRNGSVSSEYWYTEDGVIRGSKHWGAGVASCDWFLEDMGTEMNTNKLYGEAKWGDFVQKTEIVTNDGEATISTFDNTVGGKKGGYDLMTPVVQGFNDDTKIQYASRDEDLGALIWEEMVAERDDEKGRDSVFFMDNDDPTKFTYQQQEYMEQLSKNSETAQAMNAALHQVIGEGKKVDVDKFAKEQARKLRLNFGSKADKTELQDAIKSLCSFMNEALQKDANRIAIAASNIGSEVMHNIMVDDDSMSQMYPTLKKELLSYKMKPSEKAKKDMAYAYDTYQSFRRRAFNKLTLVGDDADRFIRVDSAYMELSEKYPELFPADVENESDQLLLMMEVAQELNGKTIPMVEAFGTPEDEIDATAYMIGQDILSDYYKAAGTPAFGGVLESVRRDLIKSQKEEIREAVKKKNEKIRKQNEQIRDLKERLAEKNLDAKEATKYQKDLDHLEKLNALARQQERYEGKLGKLRGKLEENKTAAKEAKRYQAALLRMQMRFDKKLEKMQERQNNSEARTRLLKAAQTLARMKGGPEFEARKEALIGDLDLIAKGLRKDTEKTLSELRAKAGELAAIDENYAGLSYDAARALFERLEKKQIKKMTGWEVAELTRKIVELTYMQQETNKLLKKEIGIKVSTTAMKLMEGQKKAKGINERNALGAAIGRYRLNMLNPTRAMALLDGYAPDGVLKKLGDALNEGQTKMNDFIMKASKKFNGFLEEHEDLAKTWYQTDIDTGLKDAEGKPIYINKGMRISLYLHSLNGQNLNHIAGAGLEIPDAKLYQKGKYSVAYRYSQTVRLMPTDIKRIVAGMTEDEKAFANLAREFLNKDTKAAINETSMVLNGTEKANVNNYFPITTDKDFVMRDITGLIQDATIEGMGMLKERRQGAKVPILLEDVAVVLQRQTQNTARYYGLAIPVRDFNKVIQWKKSAYYDNTDPNAKKKSIYQTLSEVPALGEEAEGVRKSIKDTWGTPGLEYIENVLKDIQTGGQGKEGPGTRIFESLKSTYAGTVLNWNIGVSIKQAASAPFAATVLDAKSVAKAFAGPNFFKKADLEYMDSITPWSYMRRQGMSGTEMGEVYKPKNMVQKSDKLQWFKQHTNFIQAVDVWTTNRLFKATEYYVQDHFPKLEVRGEEYNKKVAELYNDMLQRTQPSYDVMQRNAFLRSDSAFTKVFGMFKTQTFNMGAEVIDAWGRLSAYQKMHKNNEISDAQLKKVKKQFGKTIQATIASQLVLTLLGVVAKAVYHNMKNYRDDKGEVTPESVAMRAVYEFLTSFAGMTMLGSEVQSFLLAKTGMEKWYDLEYPGLSVINDYLDKSNKRSEAFRKAVESGWKADDAEKFRKCCIDEGMSLLILGRVPADNIYKLANGLYLHWQDFKNGDIGKFEAGDSLLGIRDSNVTAKQYQNRAKEAFESGDIEKGDSSLDNLSGEKIKEVIGEDADLDENGEKISKSAKYKTIDALEESDRTDEKKGELYAKMYESDGLSAWVEDGGSEYDYMMGNKLEKEVSESAEDGKEYAYVVKSNDYTAQQKVAWFRSNSRRTTSKNYAAWTEAGYSEWDYIKYTGDLQNYKGLDKKEKQEKVISYIKKQTKDPKKRKILWNIAGYKDSTYDKYMN